MSTSPANPTPFRLQPGGALGFGDDEMEALTWPECHEPPEVELLGRLKEAGAHFPDEAAALDMIRGADLRQQGPSGQQVILRLITRLTAGRTARQAGQMVFVLAHGLSLPGCRTQSDLADKMEISQGRVSQLIKEIGEFSS